ncbi:glycosyltransferase [Phaeodactylibacter sp.]|uniref:glycosyltransferase family 4 protein n=1 Tax=Phaeodactylibacter sp. TaxID=1940289 RepID=UPI0025CE8741|nr:glycosyltransferase [Phaeodactylibacter sp.]MCI5056682.1 glycosyltransferase [Flavobacteriales bacterium]MCI5090796.1 glycosyltransferase [Phaeodactylibacter sp.]
MKIVINTAHQRFGGAIQVALSFIHECRRFAEHEYYIWVGSGVRTALDETVFPANFHFRHFDFGAITIQKTFIINRSLQQAEREIQPDCIIATTGPSYFHSKAPQIIGFNLPLYIYPESPYVQQLSFKQQLKMLLKKKAHFYFFKRDANAYVVQTEDVNQRVRKELKTSAVNTVTNTASQYYSEEQFTAPKLLPKEPDRFRFLTLSSYYPHKNLELIPAVLKELHQRGISTVDFVLTLKNKDFQAHIGDHPNIINVGPVPPPEGPGLYAECDGMFLPTLAECFSASYPEAMKMEKPIITTDLGFAKSICQKAALYFTPRNALSAANAIEKLVRDKKLQKHLIHEGSKRLRYFDTPSSRAQKYLEICRKYAKTVQS